MRSVLVLSIPAVVWACEPSEPARPPPQPGYAPTYQGPPQTSAVDTSNLPERRPEDVSRVVEAATPRFSDCYFHSESYMFGKSGTYTVFFDIDQAGVVTAATDVIPPGVTLPGAPLADPKLGQCLIAGMYNTPFGFARGPLRASWTFQFAR
ncbi:MAG: hypothetical protein IPI67_27185 [Myxococcales bacterium]|nr:hypothetical protein [Myxococcales bacterium]